MATKQIGWLIAALAVTPALFVACGGDDDTTTSTGTATGGAGGTGGSTGGSAGSSATGGTAGTAGSGGTAGKGGSSSDGGGNVPDGRTPCGTTMNGCAVTGNNVCDVANNRCVECLSDMDCADEATQKVCNLTPSTMGSMLPIAQCVQCLTDAQCPTGSTCVLTGGGQTVNTCRVTCGTTTCATNPTGNNICDAPNNRCVGCMSNADCADETTDKVCDTSVNPTNMLPRYSCEECLATTDCPAGNVCIGNNCEPTCSTDADCSADGGGQNPHCNPTTKVCSECAADSHCTSMNQPFCGPEGECDECFTDANCLATQPTLPYCRLTDTNCVQCLNDTHCTAPATCNVNNGRCTGGPDGGGTTPDSGTPDVGLPDLGTPDLGTPDLGTPDLSTPDTGGPG